MGIPGLASQLHKYGKYTSIQQTKAQTGQQTAAIIDGPSLAHSIYHLGKYEVAKDGIVSQYNYDAIGKAAVAWVDRLRSYGFNTEGIYFDGGLPAYKKQTRLDRVQGYVNRLVNYRQVHAQAMKAKRPAGFGPVDDRLARGVEKARNGLPPPPFLVFEVVEALFASKYANCVWLVDGEADAYCAAAASEASTHRPEYGSVVLTNDSDLVVFNSKAPVRIVMINEMKETGSPSSNRLELYEIDPISIAVKCGVPDLVACAYYMREHQASLTEALRKHDSFERDSADYHEFAKMYDVVHWNQCLQQLRQRRQDREAALCLDSRVSEPICQAARNAIPTLNGKADHMLTTADNDVHLDLFLPVLFEDTTRSSAWKIGGSFREATEQLILHASPPARSLLEYRRSGTRIAPVQVDKAPIDELNAKLRALSARLQVLQSTVPHSTSEIISWKLIVAIAVLQGISERVATIPSTEDVVSVLTGDPLMTWELVHLSAQFQAQYYSLRMLKQILQWWENERRRDAAIIVPDVLQQQLHMLPGIAKFHLSVKDEAAKAKLEEVLEEILTQQGAPVVRDTGTMKGKKRRDKQDKNDAAEPPRKRADLTSNPFALLDESDDG